MSKRPFKPAWWLPGPHLQTVWPTFCRRQTKKISLTRERFELPDGDFVDLDWLDKNNATGPIVLILHGLEGSIESPYAKGMLIALAAAGFRPVFMHFRGCSGEPNRLPRSYHSGDTGDVSLVVDTLIEREPQTKIAAVGFSMGGNVLLKWLGETGVQNPLFAAVAISVPFDLHKVIKRLQCGVSKIYQWYLLKSLQEKMRVKFQRRPAIINVQHIGKLRTLRDFDDHVTAPLHGFTSAHDYYTQSSSRQYLNAIHVPTLLLQAKNDPFMTEDTIPPAQELSSSITLEALPGGGHVGFVTGLFPWRAEYWLDWRVPDFLREHLRE